MAMKVQLTFSMETTPLNWIPPLLASDVICRWALLPQLAEEVQEQPPCAPAEALRSISTGVRTATYLPSRVDPLLRDTHPQLLRS